jgi:hypothetical protein
MCVSSNQMWKLLPKADRATDIFRTVARRGLLQMYGDRAAESVDRRNNPRQAYAANSDES